MKINRIFMLFSILVSALFSMCSVLAADISAQPQGENTAVEEQIAANPAGFEMIEPVTEQETVETTGQETEEAAEHETVVTIDNEVDLKNALNAAQPGETIYVVDMRITTELYFEKNIDVTISSADGSPVKLSTVTPSTGTYPFNFNGGNVKLTFNNVIIEGDGTHVLMRCQSTGEVSRTIKGAVFRKGFRAGNGAALYVENGNITVENCVFENNTAARGAAFYLGNNVKTGGNGDAVIKNCTFINNTATDFEGGAVSVRNDHNPEKGNLTVINCTFENNHAIGKHSAGGAVAGYGNVAISSSRFTNNSASFGGAISAGGENCVISACTILSNRSAASDDIYELYKSYDFPCGGGGIYSSSADITLSGSILKGNSSAHDGGAICSSNGMVALNSSTISGNSAAIDGGGVWISDLSMLTTSNMVFEDNSASNGYFWRVTAPSDDKQTEDAATHGEQILNTSYTYPYVNVYSNHDVNYATVVMLTPYTVTYNGNGDDAGTAPADKGNPYLTGETVRVLLPPDSLVKSGYSFLGWNTRADGKGKSYTYDKADSRVYPLSLTMGNADVVLYAQWGIYGATVPGQPGESEQPIETPEITVPPEPENTPNIPSEYPPGYTTEPTNDNTVKLKNPDGTTAGEWVERTNGWVYVPNQNSQQLVQQEDGSFEVVDPDGTPAGLWSKNEDDDWVYEENAADNLVWYALLGLLFVLGGLAGVIYFFVVARRYVTREEFTRMTAEAVHIDAVTEGIEPYEDVSEDASYYQTVMSAKAAGVLSGFPGREFLPEISITREEIASIMAGTVRYASIPVASKPMDLSKAFRDYDSISELFLEDVRLTVQLKLMPKKEKFKPEGLSTKKQAKKIVDDLSAVISSHLPSD